MNREEALIDCRTKFDTIFIVGICIAYTLLRSKRATQNVLRNLLLGIYPIPGVCDKDSL